MHPHEELALKIHDTDQYANFNEFLYRVAEDDYNFKNRYHEFGWMYLNDFYNRFEPIFQRFLDLSPSLLKYKLIPSSFSKTIVKLYFKNKKNKAYIRRITGHYNYLTGVSRRHQPREFKTYEEAMCLLRNIRKVFPNSPGAKNYFSVRLTVNKTYTIIKY